MPTSDPLYALVDLWREGKVRQIILMDRQTARTFPDDTPLEWPWSIVTEDQHDADGYQRDDLSRFGMGGSTPDHAAQRALKWITDPKFRQRIIRKWDRANETAMREAAERRRKEKADADGV